MVLITKPFALGSEASSTSSGQSEILPSFHRSGAGFKIACAILLGAFCLLYPGQSLFNESDLKMGC